MSSTKPTPEEREKRLDDAFAELRASRAKIPPEQRNQISPELKALIGLAPTPPKQKSDYEEYYEYMARKHR